MMREMIGMIVCKKMSRNGVIGENDICCDRDDTTSSK